MADHKGSRINPPIDLDTVASKHPDALAVAAQETISLEQAIRSKVPSPELAGVPVGKVVTGVPKDMEKFRQSQESQVAGKIFKHGLGSPRGPGTL